MTIYPYLQLYMATVVNTIFLILQVSKLTYRWNNLPWILLLVHSGAVSGGLPCEVCGGRCVFGAFLPWVLGFLQHLEGWSYLWLILLLWPSLPVAVDCCSWADWMGIVEDHLSECLVSFQENFLHSAIGRRWWALENKEIFLNLTSCDLHKKVQERDY